MSQTKPLSFRTTFNKPNLLRNYPVVITWENGRTIEFRIPTVGEIYGNLDFDTVIAVLRSEPEEFEKNVSGMGFIATTSFELMLGTINFSKIYSSLLRNFFETYISHCVIRNKKIYVDDIELSESEYNIIRLLMLIGLGLKPYSEFTDLDKKAFDDSSLDETSRQLRRKLEAARKKVEQAKASKQANVKIEPETIFLSIIYELPSISLFEIFNWNYFTLYWYFDNIPTLVNNKIQTIAAGNGIAKDYKYFAHEVKK